MALFPDCPLLGRALAKLSSDGNESRESSNSRACGESNVIFQKGAHLLVVTAVRTHAAHASGERDTVCIW